MYVLDLSVAEKYRGQGYGSAMIKHIVADVSKLAVHVRHADCGCEGGGGRSTDIPGS